MTSSQQSGAPWKTLDCRLTLHVPSVAATDTSPKYEALDWTVNVGINHQFDSPDTALWIASDGKGPLQASGILGDDSWTIFRGQRSFLRNLFDLVTGNETYSVEGPSKAELTKEDSAAAMSRFLKACNEHSEPVTRDLLSKCADVETLFSTIERDPTAWPSLQRALRDREIGGLLRGIIENDVTPLSGWLGFAGIGKVLEFKSDETYPRRFGAPGKSTRATETAEADHSRAQ